MRKQGIWKAGLATLVAVFLASCSGNLGDNGNPVVLAGVVASDGTLAGMTLELTSARITQNGEPTDRGLKPGMVVEVQGQAQGTRVRVEAADIKIELTGPIEAIDLETATLTVLGTPVRVDALTRIEEENGTTLALADLKVGDFVEVSGVREADGTVLAGYIERKSGDESYVEAKGFACALDTTAQTFALWSSADCTEVGADTGILVDYASAQVEGTPAEGVPVEVEGKLETGTLRASEVEFGYSHDYPGESVEIELYGPLTNLDETQMTFELVGYTVDYANARVEGVLVEGAYVEVEGTPDASDPTLVHAYEVEVKYPSGSGEHVPTHEAKGPIEAIDPDARTLTVAGMDFYADDHTIVKEDDPDRPIAFADLAVGDWVEVKYDATAQNADGAYYAVKIEREGYEDRSGEGYAHELEGYVQNLDRENRTFEVGGVLVTVNDATRYEDDRSDRDLAADEFWSLVQEGDRVEVKGTYQEGSLLAYEIELKDPHDD